MKIKTIILLLRIFFSACAVFCIGMLAYLTEGEALPKWTAIPSAILAVICLVIAILLTPNGTKSITTKIY